MPTEVVDGGPERPSLTVVDTAHEPVPSPVSDRKARALRTRAPHRKRANISQASSNTAWIDTANPDDTPPLTSEALENYRRSLARFRALVQELLAGTIAGTDVAREPKRLTRNPFKKFYRWFFEQEPGFEELLGKYASLLPVLERPSGIIYSEMATIGVEALRARRLAISETVYDELRYRTSTSAALGMVMKGVGLFIVFFLTLTVLLPGAAGAGIFKWGGAEYQTILNFLAQILPPFKTVGIAILFGCLGSVVSLLLRIGEFEGAKGKSKAFLLLYGFTLPVVGGIFAAVISALLDLNIVKIGENRDQVYIIVGFLSGFSERFTRNILGMAEDRLFLQGARRDQPRRPR